jgi:quercetin dioxygenase-like cupin family protein
MKPLAALVPILVAASLILSSGVAFGQQPPAPVPVLETRFPAPPPPGPYDELLLVLDLAPGTEFPDHWHGGPVFLSVVKGTLWDRSGGRETTLNAGETLTEETGRVHAAGNRGPGRTRLLITVLLPPGAGLTTDVRTAGPQDLPAGATVAAQAILEGPRPAAPMDVVHRVSDLPVGAAIAPHAHPGPNLNILLQGQVVLNMQGVAHPFAAAESWVEPAGVVHGGANTGATTARLVGSALVPRGAPVAAPAPVAGQLPRTGGPPAPGGAAVLIGLGLVLGGVVRRLRPPSRRRRAPGTPRAPAPSR